jgi:hypothetical protein
MFMLYDTLSAAIVASEVSDAALAEEDADACDPKAIMCAHKTCAICSMFIGFWTSQHLLS